MFRAFSSRNRNNSTLVHNVRDLLSQIESERLVLDRLEQIGQEIIQDCWGKPPTD
jgi:hypothetical protein